MRPDERMLDGYHSLANGYRLRAHAAEARVAELEELLVEAHQFGRVLAELKVRTRPIAEAWLDKYAAAFPKDAA